MTEEQLHRGVCSYLRLQHPKVMFNTDLSGIRLTQGQAKKLPGLRSSRGMPDLFIMEPRGSYHGLFIELKRDGEKLHQKNGKWKNTHIEEQAEILSKLKMRGYKANFAIGFDEAREIIDEYLKLPLK